jgi:hypothetical protein
VREGKPNPKRKRRENDMYFGPLMSETQTEIYNKLCELSGEEVLNLITDYHGLQLLDKGFKEHLEDEGVL